MQKDVCFYKKIYCKTLITSFLLVCTCFTSFGQSDDIADSLFLERLNRLNLNIKIPYNKAITKNIDLLTHQGKDFAARILGIFLEEKEYIDSAFKAVKLPQELQYLPLALMQENFTNENKCGFWKLPHFVAIKYGLNITEDTDERFDVKKSMDAAIAYLQNLSEKYSDFWDVIIAYSNSAAALESAKIRTNKDPDIWILSQQGNLANKNIITNYITSIYIANFYQLHYINPVAPEKNTDNLEYILPKPIATPVQTKQNPSNYIPKPFVAAKKDDKKKVTYTVKSGDNLTKIAKKYNVTIVSIQKWNNLKNDRINIGQKLLIYL